jgi:DNA modification methylase
VIHYQDQRVTLHHANCLDVLAGMADNSVDSIVTDPPYGLSNTDPKHVTETIGRWVAGERDYVPGGAGFMGKAWDAFVPPPAVWDECLRVLKPGGHALVFSSSRTTDLMTLSLRLAGFEIRDSIAWLYGGAMPKSLDVGKAIDKTRDDNPERSAVGQWLRTQRKAAGLPGKDVASHWPSVTGGPTGCVRNWELGFNCPTWDQWLQLKDIIGFPDDMDVEVWRLNGRKGTPGEAWEQREVIGIGSRIDRQNGAVPYGRPSDGDFNITAPATPAAKQWQGWGTGLRPSMELICVARKPIPGTVAACVQEWGTGGINIDGCRIATDDDTGRVISQKAGLPGDERTEKGQGKFAAGHRFVTQSHPAGRWPANVVLDDTSAAQLDHETGERRSFVSQRHLSPGKPGMFGAVVAGSDFMVEHAGYGDKGGASKFFPVMKYQAKAPQKERPSYTDSTGRKIAHPTVKPLTLARWLVRLVTPPDGLCVDPFAGSGTTIEAAMMEGFRCIGVEQDESYLPLIMTRIQRANDAQPQDAGMFEAQTPVKKGRWPANVVMDKDTATALDEETGISRSAVRPPTGIDTRGIPNDSTPVVRRNDTMARGHADTGGASRFFPVFDTDGNEVQPQDTPVKKGRWPANVVMDKDTAAVLDEETGILSSHDTTPGGQWIPNGGDRDSPSVYGAYGQNNRPIGRGDSGGASRYFPVFDTDEPPLFNIDEAI